jgi:hypothetical protein
MMIFSIPVTDAAYKTGFFFALDDGLQQPFLWRVRAGIWSVSVSG